MRLKFGFFHSFTPRDPSQFAHCYCCALLYKHATIYIAIILLLGVYRVVNFSTMNIAVVDIS